jgi:hypothetical protein
VNAPALRPIRRPVVLAAVAAVAAAAAALIAPAVPAAAADACSDSPSDLVAGAPRFNASRGVVDVHTSGRPAQRLTRSSLGVGAGAAADEFGASIARARTGTGCGLLAIGAPGVGGRGAVYLTADSASGYGTGGTVVVTAPAGAAGDRFGETVLISRAEGSDPNAYELWVGAPRRDAGRAVDAGALERYSVTTEAGGGRFRVEHEQTLRQGMATMPGSSAEPGDRFGEVLTGAERGLVVGVPHENVGAAVDAGMVTMITWSHGIYRGVRNVTQATAGIPGAPESGDRFGAAVTPCAHVIGVPGEDVGRIRDAGLAQELRGCDPARLLPGRALTQDTRGVPGSAEAGDRFGSAVAEVISADDGASIFIGSPGEDVGSIVDAGSVAGEFSCGLPPCGWRLWTQGSGLPGAPEAGDGLGSTLSVRQFYTPAEAGEMHETTFPLISAPGEDLGSAKDAGAAYLRRVTAQGGVDELSVTFSGGRLPGLRFGTVFAADVYGYRAS